MVLHALKIVLLTGGLFLLALIGLTFLIGRVMSKEDKIEVNPLSKNKQPQPSIRDYLDR